jgi:diguanylate cyclase (GGDEF)-like protein
MPDQQIRTAYSAPGEGSVVHGGAQEPTDRFAGELEEGRRVTSGREAAVSAGPEAGASSRRARFQPIVDLRTGRPIGWEARPHRWLDDAPDGGLAVLSSLAQAGAPPDDGLVFVHVSADLLGDPRLFEEAERLGSRIVVDVRGAEVDRLGELSSELDALATAGIHLSIENTSGVSLAMIARVRPTFVKLDAPLVRDIVHEPANRSVVRAYVAFAEHEGIHVIAEGVERHDQLDELRALGVHLARGPLFGQPTADWSPPSPQRRRPPLVLDPVREAREALADAADPQALAQLLVTELRRLGDRAAVYYERDGLLRCAAHDGHSEVLDGLPVRTGVLGRALRTSELVRSDDEARVRAADAIRAGERVVGVAALEADQLTAEQEEHLRGLVRAAGERLSELGAPPRDSTTHQLARTTLELAQIHDVQELEASGARFAVQVGALSSALFALPGTTGLDGKGVLGPLAPELRRLSAATLLRLLESIGTASSCLVVSGSADGLPGIGSLLEAGASTVMALPVRSAERGTGLLIVADHAPVDMGLDRREALELLARELGRALDVVMLVDDLRTRATVDTLTGLGNLAAFQDALDTLGARRRGGWALVMADVDGLKAVNDTHGHLTGDLALRSLATALHDVLRAEDRMYRIGGDEFAALLQDVDAEGAADIGRRMCEAARSVMSDFGAGLSVGIAIPEQGEAAADFIDRADKMLYEVKRSERGTVRVAPPTRSPEA